MNIILFEKAGNFFRHFEFFWRYELKTYTFVESHKKNKRMGGSSVFEISYNGDLEVF